MYQPDQLRLLNTNTDCYLLDGKFTEEGGLITMASEHEHLQWKAIYEHLLKRNLQVLALAPASLWKGWKG